ncbi:MAG: UPF0147 family protein [Candidatus Aenigmarchaeota archaeon]|nr:UPF0147 family protein [Candidatus Aenigmarchaeota archaeon]
MTMDENEIIKFLSQIAEDRTVPRNIRKGCKECIETLKDESEDMSIRINACISILDELSNDPNIPSYTRTQVWNIVSMLEALQHNLS